LMHMSYKAVWGKIKATEKHMNACIVHTDRKEGSRLSQTGKDLLTKYKRLKSQCISADDRIFNGIFH
jgi:molybdate transport system regulatory protein